MKPKIWLSSPHLGGRELEFVRDAFATNWVAPLGPHVDGFEQDLQAYTDAPYAAALSSGTAALHLALINLGVAAQDEVLCPTFTFSATANPILYEGATPVFVESEADTWNMSPAFLEEAIQDRLAKGKRPKAVVLVHLYGMPANLAEILEVCQRYGLPLIEDAAEALGSTYRGRALGTFGAMGVLSFNGNKIITTSGGGALLTSDKGFAEHARFLAAQARDPAPHYQHSHVGYNYRLSNVCAAIGRGQMRILDERVKQRRANFERYKTFFAGHSGITLLAEPPGAFSNRWLSCVLVSPDATGGITREDLRLTLAGENIESRPLWKPLHLQPIFRGYPYYGNRLSEQLFEQGLCLPSGSNLLAGDFERIFTALSHLLGNQRAQQRGVCKSPSAELGRT